MLSSTLMLIIHFRVFNSNPISGWRASSEKAGEGGTRFDFASAHDEQNPPATCMYEPLFHQ